MQLNDSGSMPIHLMEHHRRAWVLGAAISVLVACGDSTHAPVPVNAVVVNPDTAAVEIGQARQLAATLRDGEGNVLSGRQIEWRSGTESVATVSHQGLVTAVAVGQAVITATSEGRSGSAQVVVVPVRVASLVVAPDTATVEVGQTRQLIATLRDAAGNVLTGRQVQWSSGSDSVATVSQQGVLTAVATGQAVITATSEGRSGSAQVVAVPVPVASVVVAPDTATVEVGQTRQLIATLLDAAGNVLAGRHVQWSSGSSSVATVSQQGVVTAVGVGQAVITATSEGRSASAHVVVIPVPVASVVVDPDTATIEVGHTRQLIATLRDALGTVLTGRQVEWSTDGSVATVSQQGLVTAVAVGHAAITAASEGRSGSAQVVVVPKPTDVSGIIHTSTTWSVSHSPYRLLGTVQIAYGATLTIEPGVEVIGQDERIEVFGNLESRGTAAAWIRFADLHIVGSGSSKNERHFLDISNTTMTRGSLYRPTGNAVYGTLRLQGSILRDMTGHNNLLYISNPTSDVLIERNVFTNTGGLSINVNGGVTAYIRNNAFYQQRGHNIAGPQYMFAVQSLSSSGGSRTIVELNSFWSIDRVAVRLPAGYPFAAMTATNNYWGTTDEAVIQTMIYDKTVDLNSAGTIDHKPFLTAPHPQTPAL
jgi:uncharacterized protein YjdB